MPSQDALLISAAKYFRMHEAEGTCLYCHRGLRYHINAKMNNNKKIDVAVAAVTIRTRNSGKYRDSDLECTSTVFDTSKWVNRSRKQVLIPLHKSRVFPHSERNWYFYSNSLPHKRHVFPNMCATKVTSIFPHVTCFSDRFF